MGGLGGTLRYEEAMPVRLDRITTRTGDDGTTAVSDGTRLAKDHPLIAAIGAVDRANSVLGMVRLQALPERILAALPLLQNELFDLGADLATPMGGPNEARLSRLEAAQVAHLEALIAEGNAGLPPLTSFVLPTGCPGAAWLHLARVDVREAERAVVRAASTPGAGHLNPRMVQYLNRLSDLLFIWSRLGNRHAGVPEPLWQQRAAASPAPSSAPRPTPPPAAP